MVKQSIRRTVALDRLVASNDQAAVVVTAIWLMTTGLELLVSSYVRGPNPAALWPLPTDVGYEDRLVVTVQFQAGGGMPTTAPGPGWGSDYQHDQIYRCGELPPGGSDVLVAVDWPQFNIGGRTLIGAQMLSLHGSPELLWPSDDRA